MKYAMLAVMLLTVVGCATAPTDRRAQAIRVCQGETANQQTIGLGQLAVASDENATMHRCLYQHGVRQ